MAKNKTIIIGESGIGKTELVFKMGLLCKGTSIICNGSVDKKYYEEKFPPLKEYEKKDEKRPFYIEKRKKYYLHTNESKSAVDFINSLIFGCDYGTIGDDKEATVIYDDNAWVNSENNLLTLWRLSHLECRIVITGNSICDILKIDETELTEKMVKDISRYWNIIELKKED